MKTIGDLLARDLNQKIEEIIKVDQTDEQSVYTEITEYVATDRIKDQYRDLLRAIAEAPADPHEGIGVWISGFFGSGKSSFAKNLGYVLANRTVLGHEAGELFKGQVDDRRIGELVDFIKVKLPTEVIMFDVSVDRAVKKSTERIAEVMYTVLLRELDYAQDYDVAELEIELEAESRLAQFMALCQQMYQQDWRIIRKGAQKIARASALLHQLDPATYATADSWSQSLGSKEADITVGKFVERAFDLCARRRPGKALVFIIDEVGQYVARSADKIEDLRAVVEQFGKVGKNRVKAKQAVAPVWVVVTSQEKLDEVVAAIDSRRVELAKLQDRFKYRIDLAPADIREVATRRVLAKTETAAPLLQKLFNESQGQLNAACRLERTTRISEINAADFVSFYPYLPHFLELSIDIMSGIRLQPGAPKHLGGSNRTIIKQAYEMLVSPRTAMAQQPLGTLVTLDRIFELVEGNLSSEKQKDISDIKQRFSSANKASAGSQSPLAHASWEERVAKAICLLEFVRDLPRTEANIAACLVDEVGQPAPLTQVQPALQRLYEAQFIRNTEEGWKLQTAQEKNWETERRSHLSPKPKFRAEIVREGLGEIFGDPKLKTYRFRDLKNFRVGLNVDGVSVGEEGQVPLSIITAADGAEFPAKLAEVRQESRHDSHKNDLYWVFALTAEIDDLVANLYASRQMVTKYDQLRAQNKITNEEVACLSSEKVEVMRVQSRLRDKLLEALQAGSGLFQGVSKDGSALGKTVGEIFKALFDFAVPDLYPKLELGARALKGTEAEEILKAANLSALAQVFYGGEQGLNLVVKGEGGKYVPNPEADVAKEVLDYLVREHSYGNRESRTGKAVEAHFGGLGYGWDRDILRLVLAVLLRAGSIEVSYQGQRFDSYQDPRCRTPFINNVAFKAALFTPTTPLDLKTLVKAVSSYESLTGQTVEVDKNAIATAFKKLAQAQLQELLPVEAEVKAYQLPVASQLAEWRTNLNSVLNSAADDCVRILAGEGASLKEAQERLRQVREVVNGNGLATLRQARLAVQQMWPVLEGRGQNGDLGATAATLQTRLAAESFYLALAEIKTEADLITTAYREVYAGLHSERSQRYNAALEEIKGQPDWAGVTAEMQPPLLHPLTLRACSNLAWTDGAIVCQSCRATLSQMESDLAAVAGLKAQALARIVEITTPADTSEVKLARVRLIEFFPDNLETEQAIDEAVERLREHLVKLLAEGVKIIPE
ncbi:MAG: BREX system P-loop protein BrxC [Anaerolineae bacterium]|nr:BREX system P-loop protein BrxC [Anaerolineae bacterium]